MTGSSRFSTIISPLQLLIAAVSISACAHTPGSYDVHYGASAAKQHFLKKVLVLPADVTVRERFAGELYEEIPLWAQQANRAVAAELTAILNANLGIQATGKHDPQEAGAIKQHLPLIKNVARAVRTHSSGFDLWPHKIHRFDYTVGEGLHNLKKRGIDAVLFAAGAQAVEVFRYDLSKTGVYTYRRKDLSFGELNLVLMLIDTGSGELLWTYFGNFSDVDSRSDAEIQAALARAFEEFPATMFDI